MMINKTIEMIVMTTNPKKSSIIIFSNSISTILTTSILIISQLEAVEDFANIKE